ncbi:MAG: hypothetical protein H8E30_11800, partial [Alphaproteobacteria bacterium]|nr:hypothetical protein [Alphaproteobacteria bacterium]
GANGLQVTGDGVVLEDFTLKNTPCDGIRVVGATGITFQRVTVGWDAEASVDNGAYGLYPVECSAVVEIEAHYASYLGRQQADIEAYRRDEALELPSDLNYDHVVGFSNEVREKLKAHGPATLGAAGRIPGITPAALTVLLAYVRRGKRRAVA